MKKKILNVLKFIGIIVLVLVFAFSVYTYSKHRDKEDKHEFENLKHGETMNTNSGYVYEVINNATDSVVLWDKKYKMNKHVIKKNKNIIACLYGPDTLTIYIEERINSGADYNKEYWYIDITKK